MATFNKSLRPILVLQCVVLLTCQLSHLVTAQGNFLPDPSDYDYVDYADFRSPAVAPQAALPPRPVQRQRNQALPPRQFQANTRGELPPSRRPSPGRGEAVPQDIVQREQPRPVAILKQINEHNEDGSYSYGYEADDGSFKLETRHVDGRVQGKYGYIDIDTGELKIIEYGADMMGFQPHGDLPEGIVVPPPVPGNATFDYDYDTGDYVDQSEIRSGGSATAVDENSVRVQNRARGNAATPLPGTPTQNRGQNVRAPPTSLPKQREQIRNSFLPTPAAPTRTRFRAQPAIQQQPTRQPQLPRPGQQSIAQSAVPVRQQEPPVDSFRAFQTNFDSNTLSAQGLKPFVPQQPRRPQAQPTLAPRRPAPQPVRRPQENVRALRPVPSRRPELTREEVQEFQEINEIKSRVRPVGAVRSQIAPQRTTQRGSLRRVVAQRPANTNNDPRVTSTRQPSTRSRGRARGSSRTRTSAPSASTGSRAPLREEPRVNRPISQTPSVTEDPLAVLRSLQASSGGSTRSNTQQPSPSRSPSPTSSSSRLPGLSSSSSSKFSSFPQRESAGTVTSSLPVRKPQNLPQSERPRQPPSAQPIRTVPQGRPQQPRQQEQERPQQRLPIRIKPRPALQLDVNSNQPITPLRLARPVIAPQQPLRRPVQQRPAQVAVRTLPQQQPQTQNRFLPTPSQPLTPTPAVPSRVFPNQPAVDFDALISEFTGRQTPRPQIGQQPFLGFRPTVAARPAAGGVPPGAFVPRPAAAVPPAFQTSPSPNFDVNGASFQLVTQLGSS